MKIQYFIIIASLVFCFACQNNNIKKPSLTVEEMRYLERQVQGKKLDLYQTNLEKKICWNNWVNVSGSFYRDTILWKNTKEKESEISWRFTGDGNIFYDDQSVGEHPSKWELTKNIMEISTPTMKAKCEVSFENSKLKFVVLERDIEPYYFMTSCGSGELPPPLKYPPLTYNYFPNKNGVLD